MKSLAIIFLKGIGFLSVLLIVYYLIMGSLDGIDFMRSILSPAIVFTCLFLVVHYRYANKSGVIENFSANQNVSFQSNVELSDIKNNLIKDAKWELVSESSESLIFKTGMVTFKSFGEKIKINKNQSTITIQSKPRIFTTIFDFGKNFQNIKKVQSIIVS